MSKTDLESILKQIKKYVPNQQGLHIAGGEPFLNFDLTIRAVELCVELGERVAVIERVDLHQEGAGLYLAALAKAFARLNDLPGHQRPDVHLPACHRRAE